MIFPVEPATSSRWLGRRYLFCVGSFRIPSYTALLYLGCVLGICAGTIMANDSGMNETRFALSAIVLLIPALVGGRLWFALQHPRVFLAEPRRLWRTQDGGSGIYGGLVVSFGISPPVLAAARLEFWSFWDAAGTAMLVGMLIGNFGCMMNGCCAGRETCKYFGLWLPNHAGQWRRRFPTQLLEAGWSGIVLAAVLTTRPHSFPGALFLSAAAGYATGRLILEWLREGAGKSSNATRLNFAFSVVLIFAAGLALVWVRGH